MTTKYDPTLPANDVAVDGDYCSYCGGDVTVGEPVVRAVITLTGNDRPNCRHAYDCLSSDYLTSHRGDKYGPVDNADAAREAEWRRSLTPDGCDCKSPLDWITCASDTDHI